MPLQVLIADDEYFIRKRLIKVIDWEGLDLILAGEAENGWEAIDRLSARDIDILLLDIEMPGKSGLGVAEYLFENSIPTKIIILSGYNNFEYARQALHYHAFDYLLKPVERENLQLVLRQCISQIFTESAERRDRERYGRYLRRDALYRALQNNRPMSCLYEDYPELAPYPSACFVGVFCPGQIKAVCAALANVLGCDQTEVFQETESSAVLMLFCGEKVPAFEALLNDFLEGVSGRLFLTLDEVSTVDWGKHYHRVYSSLVQRFFFPGKGLILAADNASFEDIKDRFLSVRKNLVLCLNTKDLDSFNSFVDNLFLNIGKTENPHYLNLILTELHLTFQVHFPERAELPEGITAYVTALLEEESDMDGLRESAKALGLRCIESVEQTPSDGILAGKLRAKIDGSFSDGELSVARLAEEFALTPAYLGSVFKKVTGQSIVQYITARRMEKARELLEQQSFKITQVAEEVGYGDVFYFSKKFKKYYGFPPSGLARQL